MKYFKTHKYISLYKNYMRMIHKYNDILDEIALLKRQNLILEAEVDALKLKLKEEKQAVK